MTTKETERCSIVVCTMTDVINKRTRRSVRFRDTTGDWYSAVLSTLVTDQVNHLLGQ